MILRLDSSPRPAVFHGDGEIAPNFAENDSALIWQFVVTKLLSIVKRENILTKEG